MNFRVSDDGTLIYPRRGKPPDEMPGYVRNPADKYQLIPEVDTCKHRRTDKYIRPCGKIGCHWFCTLHKRQVNVPICNNCQESES